MWKSVKKSIPHENILVKVKYMVTGNGAPERNGWQSVGRINRNKIWCIKQNATNTVDFNPPTHWDWLRE